MTDIKFVLGVDLDGVVADFYAALRPIAAEWLGVPVGSLTPNVSYGLPEWKLPAGTYDDLHRFAVTQRDLFRKVEPVLGAAPALRRLDASNLIECEFESSLIVCTSSIPTRLLCNRQPNGSTTTGFLTGICVS